MSDRLTKPIPQEILDSTKDKVAQITKTVKHTKPGSVGFLLFGSEPSKQSLLIRMGKPLGEELPKNLINSTNYFETEECGIIKLNNSNEKKDFDLIWKDEENKTIYYRESKGNLELDSEKLPATISKVKRLHDELNLKYPGYHINSGIYNWTLYERGDAEGGGLNAVKTCEKHNIKVDHFNDFINLLHYTMSKEHFESYFRNLV